MQANQTTRSVFIRCGHYLVCNQLQHDESFSLVCNEVDLIKYYEK